MSEQNNSSITGIPGLLHIPVIGGLFGSHSTNKERTELIVFMTPRVIYDMTEMHEATDELKGRLKRLAKIVKE